MNPTRYALVTAASMVILCIVSLGYAETLQEMEVVDLGPATVVVRNPEIGVLIVTSVIPNLSFESSMGIIKVDDTSPGKWILHLQPGTNLITFKAEGYRTVSNVRLVIPKKTARQVEVKPVKTLGTLIVESNPPGAFIFLDGEDTGKQTPSTFENMEVGSHWVVLKMPSFLADTTKVDIEAGEITRITRPLQAIGYLTLHTVPPDAEAIIDSGTEEPIAVRTPIERLALKIGVYSLSVYKPGYLGWKESITIERGEIVYKEMTLEPQPDAGVVPITGPELKPKKSRKWLWITTGAAVLVGGVAAVMLAGKEEPSKTEIISPPPSHP